MKICNHILILHLAIFVTFSHQLPSLTTVYQILPEQGSKQLQLDCKDTDNWV